MQNLLNNRIIDVKEDDADQHKSGNTKVLSRTTIANLGKTRTTTSLKIDHSKDKELINKGLQKLASNFNAANKIGQKPSKVVTNKSKLPTLTPTVENSIPERQLNSHTVLTKQISIDKYTMTDYKENQERKVEVESVVLGNSDYSSCQGKDLQWTDPRLLRKYCLLKQPCKNKALTVPYVNKSDYGSEIAEELSDDDDPEVVCPEDRQLFFKCLYYMCTASVSFIGSMCGISLITLILWKVLDENIFPFQLMESPKHDLFFKRHITSLAGSIICLLNTVFGKITRLLTMSTSEVFAREEESSTWYRNYIKY